MICGNSFFRLSAKRHLGSSFEDGRLERVYENLFQYFVLYYFILFVLCLRYVINFIYIPFYLHLYFLCIYLVSCLYYFILYSVQEAFSEVRRLRFFMPTLSLAALNEVSHRARFPNRHW